MERATMQTIRFVTVNERRAWPQTIAGWLLLSGLAALAISLVGSILFILTKPSGPAASMVEIASARGETVAREKRSREKTESDEAQRQFDREQKALEQAEKAKAEALHCNAQPLTPYSNLF
jgi:hypothetical protein